MKLTLPALATIAALHSSEAHIPGVPDPLDFEQTHFGCVLNISPEGDKIIGEIPQTFKYVEHILLQADFGTTLTSTHFPEQVQNTWIKKNEEGFKPFSLGKILNPQTLKYTTKADIAALIAPLKPSLNDLGKRDIQAEVLEELRLIVLEEDILKWGDCLDR